MNKRIRELAEQAWETIDVSAKLGIPGTERVFNKEKFAELIVRECAKIVEDSTWNLPHGYKAVDQAKLVKKHFGVD